MTHKGDITLTPSGGSLPGSLLSCPNTRKYSSMPLRLHFKNPSVLPGFSITLGYTLLYLSLLVVIPLSGLFVSTSHLSWQTFWEIVTTERVQAAYKVTFGISLLAALINTIFGLIAAWALVRCNIPGRRLFDALIDLPFALPTAIAGISLCTLYAPQGWIGQYLEPLGIKVAFGPLGILMALIFVGLPFTIRTVEPVLQDMDKEVEEAAAGLGATRWQIFYKIILPHITPALLTGFALSFARGLGEYGSVIFIAGNMPMVSEIVPLIIVTRLEQYDVQGATAIAVSMLCISFLLLLVINLLQRWSGRRAS